MKLVLIAILAFCCINISAQDSTLTISTTRAEVQFSKIERFNISVLIKEGASIVYSDKKIYPTKFESFSPGFINFPISNSASIINDSVVSLKVASAKEGHKIYVLSFVNQEFQVDSVIADSDNKITLNLIAPYLKGYAFEINPSFKKYFIKLNYRNKKGKLKQANNISVYNPQTNKMAFKCGTQNVALQVVLIYAKSLQIVDKDNFEKQLKTQTNQYCPLLSSTKVHASSENIPFSFNLFSK